MMNKKIYESKINNWWYFVLYLFKCFFKEKRSYAYIFALSPIATLILISTFDIFYNSILSPPQLLIFFSPIFIFGSLYSVTTFCELKNTSIINSLKLMSFKFADFFWGITVACLAISFLSFIFSMFLFRVVFYKLLLLYIDVDVLYNVDFIIWVFYFIELAIMCVTCILTFFLITSFTKNIWVNYFLLIATTLILLFMGDIIILPYYTSNNFIFCVFSYFVPTKYCSWVILYTTSYAFQNNFGIYQFLSQNSTIYVSFKNIYTPIIVIVIYQVLTFAVIDFIYKRKRFRNENL